VAVSSSGFPAVGERLRATRLERGLSLRALARQLGVSASLISQIETGKSQPSVSTLYAMTSVLGVSIEHVFEGRDEAEPGPVSAELPHDAPLPLDGRATVLDLLGSARGSRLGPLVRPDDRHVLNLDSGVTWERLGHLPSTHVDFLRITYAPGGTSSSSGMLMRHSGTEYGHLLSGELVLTLGFDEYRLSEGDSVCFESTRPHRYRNDGSVPAVGVWFVVEPG
jgi:transcriptional regulator with XRE-family HTH domain/quercetin dioxygenase-like cupin family protein